MGKKGDLLRQMKKQKAMYHFTGEELEEHDRKIYRKARESALPEMKKKLIELQNQSLEEQHADLDAYWRGLYERFKEGGTETTMANTMSYVMALCCRVLIEQFGWKPPTKKGRHTRIMKFAEALVREVGEIGKDTEKDLVRYAEETKKLYDLSFEASDAEDENPG